MASSHIDIPIRLEGEDLRQCLQAVVARSELIEKGYVTGTQRALARFQRDGLLDGGTVPTRAPGSAEVAEKEANDWRPMMPRPRALEKQIFGAGPTGCAADGDGARGSAGAAGRVPDGDGSRGSRGVAGRSRAPRR